MCLLQVETPQLQQCPMSCESGILPPNVAANAESWSRLLVRHPHVLKKLRGEIGSVLGQDKDVTRAYIQRMPYLHHVIKESK